MTRTTRPRSITATLVAGLGLLVLSGCTSDGPPDGPEGYRGVEVDRIVLNVPEDWDDTGAMDERWTVSWSDAPEQDRAARIAVAPNLGAQEAWVASSSFLASAQIGGLPDFAVVPGTQAVEGDRDLEEVRFTFTEDGEPLEGVIWSISGGEPRTSALIQVVAGTLDPALLTAVRDSLAVVDG